MSSTTRPKFQKLNRREQAKLDAAVIEHAEAGAKQSFKVVVEQLAKVGIVVSFQHVDSSCDRLGYRWGDVFAPASRVERGHPGTKQQPVAQPTDGDIAERLRSIQAAIAGLSNAIGELRLSQHAIQQHITAERQLAKDRAASIRSDMQTLINRATNCENKLENVTRILSVVRLSQERFPAVPVEATQLKPEEQAAIDKLVAHRRGLEHQREEIE